MRLAPQARKGGSLTRVINQTTTLEPITALKPHPRNVNEGDLGAILESINENGFYGAVVAQRSTGFILAGNHRYQAARQAGATELPVTWVDVDDARALRILLADNRTTRLGHDNEQALAELLKELADDGGLVGTGYDGDDLDELLKELGQEPEPATDPGAQLDKAEELREKWQTARGQLWVIPSASVPGGRHRLLCGDSTDPEDVARLMDGTEAAMVWSDPPYGLGGYAGRGNTLTAVTGDDADVGTLRAFFKAGTAPEVYVCCEFKTYEHLLASRGTPRSLIVWGKNSFGMGSGYRRQHEFIGYYGSFNGTTESDLWLEARDTNYDHPTQKPPALAARAIKNSTAHDAVIHCPFNGSGDAMVAAEQTGRQCYGMELEPKYIALVLERLAQMGLEPYQCTQGD